MANIRRAGRSGFTVRDGVRRRESFWISTGVINAAPAAASTAIILTSFSSVILNLRPFTIVRTRGFMLVRSDQQAASESYSLLYGHAVVSDQAVAVGVTAVPTPDTDSDSDLWFVFEGVFGRFVILSSVGQQPVGGTFQKFDSKSMRKVEDGQDAISVIETSSASNGANIEVMFRQLIKLH